MFFLILVFAACATNYASDVYAPCLPAIAKDMHTSISLAGWSMSVYMVSLSLTHLIYGPLSEVIGRKKPMIIGLVIMSIGSIICMNAADIDTMIFGRFIQGCGAGACASLWRSVFRDSFSGEDLSKYASYLGMFIMVIAPTAPVVGGFLQEIFGWHSNFVFLTCYSLLALIGIGFKFHETNADAHISKLNLKYIFSQYMVLLKSPLFMGTACVTFLAYGAFFSWFVAGPILLIERIGISPSKFGVLTALGGGAAFATAGIINGKLVKKFGTKFMLPFGISIMLASGISMLIGYYVVGLNLWAIMIPVVLYIFGSSFIWPNAFAIAFTPFGHIAGYAGALYGFTQIGGAALISSLVAYLPNETQLPLALVIIIASGLAFVMYRFANRESISS